MKTYDIKKLVFYSLLYRLCLPCIHIYLMCTQNNVSIFTPMPPGAPYDIMQLFGKKPVSEGIIIESKRVYDEITLDGRINTLRCSYFKDIVPKKKSHIICLWLKDYTHQYYSPGKIDIDETFLLSVGGQSCITNFENFCLLNDNPSQFFEYKFTTPLDQPLKAGVNNIADLQFGNFLKILRHILETKGYTVCQHMTQSPGVINVLDTRI